VTLIDVRSALDRLPALPLTPNKPDAEQLRGTGTDGKSDSDARFTVCCPVYCPDDESGTPGVTAGNSACANAATPAAVSGRADKRNAPLSNVGDKAGEEVRTPNIQLGRLMLCQLSYARMSVQPTAGQQLAVARHIARAAATYCAARAFYLRRPGTQPRCPERARRLGGVQRSKLRSLAQNTRAAR
jgi:hypothetical protein